MPAVTNKDEILARLNQLPAMPVVVQEVIASFRNTDLDHATLAHRIAQDQGLSAKVLRIANSPFYGLPRKIGSMQEAVMVLGFNSVRSLVLSAGFMRAFPSTPGGLFDRQAYWRRSFRVAGYTHALAQCLKQDQSLAFTAGMFYDIGQLVLDVCIPEQFAGMLEQQKTSGLSLIEIEHSLLGCDHTLIGSEVARRWNFPSEIEHAIHYWRAPEHEPFEAVTAMVHVAALLEDGLRGDALIGQLPDKLRIRLQIDRECIEAGIPAQEQIDAGANSVSAA